MHTPLKNKLVMKYPSSWWGAKWREALPSGNGTIGAAVYGAVHDETVLLTHEDLWHGVVTPDLPDVSARLPEIRQLLLANRVQEANGLLADELKHRGYAPHIGTPLPLGDLKINLPVHKGFSAYRRILDMETGEVTVSWKDGAVDYQRSLFVSRPDNLVVMEISSSEALHGLDIALGQHAPHDLEPHGGAGVHIPEQVEVLADESGFIRYAAVNDDGTDFGAVARVLPFSDSNTPVLTVNGDHLHLEGAARVLVVVKLFVQGKRQSAWPELRRQLDNLIMDYQALLAPHAVVHQELFARLQLDLGGRADDHGRSNEELLLDAYQGEACTALVEKMWAYGRYLLISSSHAGGQPCPLLGKWGGEYNGFWAFNMANENLQMIYWQALSSQLAETIVPVFDYFDRMMDDFRENARKLFGCRGIYIPAVTTPASGLLKTIAPHIIHWTGAAAWVAQHYYDYFLYTGDEKFLRERALPFLRETAQFYEDFFILDENGYYLSLPSNSPENTPGNYWDGKGMGAGMATTINATMDFALAKEVLTHLVDAAAILDLDAEDASKWEQMLGRIPPYQVNEDGAVREWMHPFFEDNYHHRHQSHIYPVFPGNEVTPHSDPELFKAFEVAIHKRLEIGISEQTGWSLAHMANVYARMKDGNQALDCLNLISRSCLKNNFYTTHNDWRSMGIGVDMQWAPFQIDANMGWSAAVQEMLLYSQPGRLSILPALPDRWAKGSVQGLRARGRIRVCIDWDVPAGKLNVALCSLGKGQTIELHLPFGSPPSRTLVLPADEVTEVIIYEASSPDSLSALLNA